MDVLHLAARCKPIRHILIGRRGLLLKGGGWGLGDGSLCHMSIEKGANIALRNLEITKTYVIIFCCIPGKYHSRIKTNCIMVNYRYTE